MFPHFLCLGAQKSGSSWLNHNLHYHPNIWLSPRKEIHYFDRLDEPYLQRFLLQKNNYKKVVRDIRHEIFHLRFLNRPDRLTWLLHYYFLPHTDAWYSNLFKNDPALICGETTPAYALLNDSIIAHIATLRPELKLIYLLRNPMERAWSALHMKASKGFCLPLEEMETDQLLEKLTTKGIWAQGDYLTHLECWQKHFSDQQIFIGFFDEIVDQPKILLQQVYQFLDVDDTEKFIPEDIHIARNARPNRGQIREDIKPALARAYIPGLKQLNYHFNNDYTAAWLATAINWAEHGHL